MLLIKRRKELSPNKLVFSSSHLYTFYRLTVFLKSLGRVQSNIHVDPPRHFGYLFKCNILYENIIGDFHAERDCLWVTQDTVKNH